MIDTAKVTRFLPLMLLAALFALAFAFHLQRFLSLDALRDNRAVLAAFVASHAAAAVVAFVAVYTVVVALSLPGAAIMSIAGGFLFGVALGGGLCVTGATAGATLLFVIARSALGDTLVRRAGPFAERMAEGFRQDAFNYLLFLRLVPAFPFWAVNLAAAVLKVALFPFVAATAVGIIPGSLAYTAFGAGLSQIFDNGGVVTLRSVLTPTLIAALVGLGVLSLLPILLKRLRSGRP